jgi:hypothetical protein
VVAERLQPGTTYAEWLSDWAYGTSTRAQAFETVVQDAKDNLRRRLPARPSQSDRGDPDARYRWHSKLFNVLCLLPARLLIGGLKEVGYSGSRFIFSFDKCSFLERRTGSVSETSW